MELIRPESIPKIDALAIQNTEVTEEVLIRRAGDAAAKEILARVPSVREALVLCGGGNNGADGYATAIALRRAGVFALAVDAFGRGQRSEGGQAVLAEYTETCGAPLSYASLAGRTADLIVDAVLGSGATGPLSDEARRTARWMNRQSAYKVALDIPLGVDADYGEACADAVAVDLTVVFAFYKRGLLSYPARGFCGELVLADLGVFTREAYQAYFCATATDAETAKEYLPLRARNSHKGSFGRLQVFSGSKKYRGAAHLVAYGALRMGVGLLTLSTEEEVVRLVGRRLPELLFDVCESIDAWDMETMQAKAEASARADATVIGPGCSVSEALYHFVALLTSSEGGPLLLDADALGAIAAHAPDVDAFFAAAKRPLVLTPHPLEFARLIGASVAEVQRARMRLALTYAKKWGVCLLLKGAGTVITDGDRLYLNMTGSSALAKGGSGDVLSGAVGAFLAAKVEPLRALALAAYLHGAAGDALAKELSEYGVRPSDLPSRMATVIATL